MLQPREPNRISDSRFKKISSLPSRINMICFIYHNQNWSLALLTALILTIVHIDASQAISEYGKKHCSFPNLVQITSICIFLTTTAILISLIHSKINVD